MDDVLIRPLRSDDIGETQDVAFSSLRDAGRRYGWEMPEPTEESRARGRRRIAHALEHDPDGAFVAERDGHIAGVALATRRGPLWFLSLLAVDTALQAAGVGKRLLETSMQTLDQAGALCASSDPKALRRYRRAGFTLIPSYVAEGTPDRRALPALPEVREGSWTNDRDLVEDVARIQRGATHGPDLDFFAVLDRRLLVEDSPAGRGYAVCGEAGVFVLAATACDVAQRLLWASLAQTIKPVEVDWISHDQQWAVDVALDARLALRPLGSRCVQGPCGPMSPYLPSGLWG